MSLCEFETTELAPGRFHHKCKNCGCERDGTTPRRVKECKVAGQACAITPPLPAPVYIQPLPSIAKRLLNFSRASISHVLAGCPTCTDEQIAERYAICRGCELHRQHPDNPAIGYCSHPTCGCTITIEGFVSKLAWADQQCPLGKWPAISLAAAMVRSE